MIKDVKVNAYGQAILSGDNLRELVLQGKHIDHLNVVFDDEIELFKQYQSQILDRALTFLDAPDEDLSFDDFHKKCADDWIFPAEYQNIDVKQWLLDKCNTQVEIDRVNEEYALYEDRDLITLLRLFIFLVDFMRENKIVWGVGRGSALSSFCLFLIGIHRVDSIKYNLHIADFLK